MTNDPQPIDQFNMTYTDTKIRDCDFRKWFEAQFGKRPISRANKKMQNDLERLVEKGRSAEITLRQSAFWDAQWDAAHKAWLAMDFNKKQNHELK